MKLVRLSLVLPVTLVFLASSLQAGSLFGHKWYAIGPAPSCCFFPGGETGRATAIAVNPLNADDVWIGTAGGGVWHSADGGGTWVSMSEDQTTLAIGSIALAGCTANNGCSRVYAGTGENAIRRDTYYGAGLLSGVVGPSGVSWTLRDGSPTYDFTYGTIYNVVLDRTTSGSGQVIYITLSSGVTASASEATVTAPTPYPGGYGIFKSTDDGVTWSRLLAPDTSTAGVVRPTDLEIDRTNPSILYAGFLGLGVFKTTDGGQTWCALNSGIARPIVCPKPHGLPKPTLLAFDHVEIDIDRADHNHLFATLGVCPDRLLKDCKPIVYESKDAGLDWTVRSSGTDLPDTSGDITCPGQYSRYMHGLTISPTNPSDVFLAGFHLCKSIDGGASWNDDGWNAAGDSMVGFRLHPDHHAIVFAESDTSRAYDVNDGGVTVSTDGGNSWTPAVDGLSAFEFQTLAVSPNTANVIGGTQDNAGVMWMGSKLWQYLSCCGDGGFSVMEKSDKKKMYVGTNPYQGLLNAVTSRSKDGGKTFPFPNEAPVYDIGINTTEVRSFYPPLFEDPGTTLWFGTTRLWSSTDLSTHYTAQSPVLGNNDYQDEILSHRDVITAMAEAPSTSSRMYLGMYSGKVYVSYGPCSSPACWTLRSSGLPGEPITWLAVDPSDPNIVYATVSGFGAGVHVYRTDSAGVSWTATASTTELNGVPANTIAVFPTAPNVLYLGTDNGVFKSETSGGSWYRFSNGLPRVPVYSIVVDYPRGRTFAATHGRGAYVLSQFFMNGYSYFESNLLLDRPILGGGFGSLQSCVIKLVEQDGTVCAASGTDALGGSVHTDAGGFLVSTKPGSFTDLPLVWACANGSCLGHSSADCNRAGNPLSSVGVICGDQAVRDAVGPPAPALDPPGATMSLGWPGGVAASSGSLRVLPSVQSGDGSSRLFCSVLVPFASGDTAAAVLARARNAVNGDGACAASGVGASLIDAQAGGEVEDVFPHPAYLSLQAPDVAGEALLPDVSTAPGAATGACFALTKVDDPVDARVRAMRVTLSTGATGAAGGSLTVIERSSLGQCSIATPTSAGASATAIAASIAAAFQSPGIPGSASCRSSANPRDVTNRGASIRTAFASDVTVCLDDPGVGVAIASADVCFTDAQCDDANPCTQDSCDTATGRCVSVPRPEGTPCDDGDPCTIGNVCVAGACGTPVSCNDRNPCTTDRCDHLTGACVSEPVACDDGDPCTADACSAETGGCVFTPTPGAACSDGDRCSVGEVCVQLPGTPALTCQGQPKCADADPCTADLCDQETGACSHPPIVCDDGNPCTADACQGGVCVTTAFAGIPCDDGNRCTSGDTCVAGSSGLPVCVGQAISCDDGNPCTADACDPITGSCGHAPIALSEVSALGFTSHVALTWPAVAGASSYNTYRGTFPPSGFGPYNQTCFERGDDHGDGALVSIDPATPPPRSGFYYLVSQKTACGEGPIGTDSDLMTIPNSSPCP